jgi:hypothetical protein
VRFKEDYKFTIKIVNLPPFLNILYNFII